MPTTKERLTISINTSVKNDLENQVPKSERSAFAEKALGDALERLARQKAIEALNALTPGPNLQNVQSEDILRDIRQGQGSHLLENNPQQ